MRRPFRCLAALLLGFAVIGSRAAEESFPLYEGQHITISVPEGFTYSRSFENGVVTARLTDTKQLTSLEISFVPDPRNRFAAPRARREFMFQNFQHFVAGSVENEMRLEESTSGDRSLTLCVFTDASLVGKTEIPRGEYLNATTGLKVWPGAAAYFTLLSHDTRSADYQSALNIVTEGVTGKKPGATF